MAVILEILRQLTHQEQIERMVHLVRLQPLVSGCIKRITDISVANGFTILERHQALCTALQDELLRPYSQFLRASVEMMFFCGFVAFTVRRVEDVPVPVVLPLGSFSWSCELPESNNLKSKLAKPPETYQASHVPGVANTNSKPKSSDDSQGPTKKQKGMPLEYRVRMITNVCRDEDVIVVPWVPPLIQNRAVIISPLAGLLARFIAVEQGHSLLIKAAKWNAERHLVVTERVDLKDQTSSGIQLLDEFRRYSVTGSVEHYNPVRRLRMTSNHNQRLDTVNDARIHWAREEFSDDTGQGASVHVLPPNTDVQELQAIDLSSLGVETHEQFQSDVLEFFNMSQMNDSAKAGNSTDVLTRSMHDSAQNIATFLEIAVVAAYAACFGLTRREVRCKVKPQARLGIDSTDDIKKLTEAQMINPAHGEKVREMFGMRKDVDRKGGNGRGNGFLEKTAKDKDKGDKDKGSSDKKEKDKTDNNKKK